MNEYVKPDITGTSKNIRVEKQTSHTKKNEKFKNKRNSVSLHSDSNEVI
jgi:hypothetical protein